MITFTEEEKAVIRRLSVRDGWAHADAKAIKQKIKKHLKDNGSGCCCYCSCGMTGWHDMTIDIEHVLPKQANPSLMFEPKNLGLSCKRCNMTIKGNDESFYTGGESQKHSFNSSHYAIIHPALDNYYDHIHILSVQSNGKRFIKYTIVGQSAKGEFTRTYFQLEELEASSLDALQGLSAVQLSSEIPNAVVAEVRQAVSRVGLD